MQFAIETDSTDESEWTVAVRVRFLPAFEVNSSTDNGLLHTRIGQHRKFIYQVTARRREDEGLCTPTAVSASSPLIAAMSGITSTALNEGWTEESRELTVEIPPL